MLRRLAMQLLLLLALLLSTPLRRHIQRVVILLGGAAARCRGGIAVAATARAAAIRIGHVGFVGGSGGRCGGGLLPAFHLVLAIVGAVRAIAPFAVQFGNVNESHEEAEER